MKNSAISITLLILLLSLSCSSPANKEDTLGELTFDVTGTDEAKTLFLKGQLRLHSFEFDDAAEAFREAQQADPDCAMAYWGEAMTYNHALWQQQDYEAAKKVLLKLGDTPEVRIGKAKTDVEKDFLTGIEILYGEGSKVERDKAYAAYMKGLYTKYPANHEVGALYALALLGSVPVGRDESIYQESAQISGRILKENPNHPGALHYFIHANDDPYHAAEALFAANAYSVVASDAAHALHMPTHIYVALGMWDQVVSSNEDSWSASVARKERKNLSNDALGYHSFHWLLYGYLEKGRVEDARKTLDDMIGYCDELPSGRARAHEIFLKSTYLVETEDWDSPYASLATDATDLNIFARGLEGFVKGMKSFHNGDLTSMDSVIATMKRDRLKESSLITEAGIALCKSGGASQENVTQLDIDDVHVMEMELEGLKAWKKDDLKAAERWFKEATALEESVSYAYGPPSIVKPSHELYGEFLLSVNRPDDAMWAFDVALQRAPKRVLSLKGKMLAAKMLKNEGEVMKLEKTLSEI